MRRPSRAVMALAVALTFALGIGLSAAAASWRAEEERAERAETLASLSEDTGSRISAALFRYADLLAALTAFQAGSDRSMEAYQAYVDRLGVGRYADVENTAFIRYVSDDELPQLVAERRAGGQPDFTLEQVVEGDAHAIVTYAAPGPAAAPGLDLLSDPARRRALLYAAQTGVPAVSGVVTPIAQRHLPESRQRPGFVVYAPIFRPGAPAATAEERLAALVGWNAISVDPLAVLESLSLEDGLLDVALLMEDADGDAAVAGESTPGSAERIAGQELSERIVVDAGRVAVQIRTAFAPGRMPAVDTGMIALSGTIMSLLAAYGVFTTLRFRRGLLARAEAERQRAELLSSRFHAAVDRAPVGVTVVSLDGSVELANDRLLELLRVPEVEDLVIYDYFLEEDLAELGENFGQLTRGEVDHMVRERRLRRSDGSLVWCRISSSTLPGPDGQPTAIVAHVQDIEAERSAIEALRSRTRWFSSIVERSSDLIVLFDRDGVITWVSPSAAAILGAAPEQLLGLQVLDFVVPEDHERVIDAIGRVLAGEQVVAEYRVQDLTGRIIWLESTGADLLDDPDVAAFITISRDVTQRHRDAELLAHRAAHDPLTGLLNRAELRLRLEAALAAVTTGAPLTVAYLDLDGFKPINDAHGHAVGDDLLRVVADILGDEVRAADSLARVGGDEFVIALGGADLAAALTIAERIRRRLHQPITLEALAEPVRVSASIGLAAASPDDTVDSLLHEADLALYEAKRRGRDRVEISPHGLAELGIEVDELLERVLREFD